MALTERRVYESPDHRFLIAVRVDGGWRLCPVRERRQRHTSRWLVHPNGQVSFDGRPTGWTVGDLEPLPVYG